MPQTPRQIHDFPCRHINPTRLPFPMCRCASARHHAKACRSPCFFLCTTLSTSTHPAADVTTWVHGTVRVYVRTRTIFSTHRSAYTQNISSVIRNTCVLVRGNLNSCHRRGRGLLWQHNEFRIRLAHEIPSLRNLPSDGHTQRPGRFCSGLMKLAQIPGDQPGAQPSRTKHSSGRPAAWRWAPTGSVREFFQTL